MMNASALLDNLVPTSAFSQGKAARFFEKVEDGSPIVVLKNNAPYRIVITPSDYRRMTELEEDLALMSVAMERLEANAGRPGIPAAEVYTKLGIDMAEIEAMDDVELE